MDFLNDPMRTHALELRTLMGMVWKANITAMEQKLAEQGLDLSRLQSHILQILHHQGEHTPSELSRKFGLDPSTLVPTINALEKKGLVVRGRDPSDRRRVPLTLTLDALAIVDRIPTVTEDDPIIQAMRAIGEDATRQLLALLCDLTQHLPENTLLESATSRLAAYGAKEEHLICTQHQR